jgi:FkbM family methyltransferase
MQTGIGRSYRDASWVERAASGSARRAPSWLRRPLKTVYSMLLRALPGDHLVCRLPGGEAFRVDSDFRQLAWNEEEYGAFKACVPEGATVMDVGANVGAYTLLFATWAGPSGRVYAFEPSIASRSGLERHLRLNGLSTRVTVRPEAVAQMTGTAPFRESGSDGDNRMLAEADAAARVVPCVSVDDFCATHGVAPDVIKVDVEGAELAVLRGARRTIAERGSQLSLFVELHPSLWAALGYTRSDLERELRAQRLTIEALPGIADPWAVEGVCVRVRRA